MPLNNAPVAWAVITDAGTCRIWWGDRAAADHWAHNWNPEGLPITPLVVAPTHAAAHERQMLTTREEPQERELAELDAAASTADFIASTSENQALRSLLFGAEKNLRAAALLIAQGGRHVV